VNLIFVLLSAASAGGQCSGCSAPVAGPVAAPYVSASSCGDCACGSVSSACAAPAEQPARKGLFHHKKKAAPAPAPAADCGCGTPVSSGCGCGSAVGGTIVGAPLNSAPINHGPVYNPAPGYSSSPIISNPGHGVVVNPGAGTPVITNPGAGSPIISTPASSEPLKAMPKSDDKKPAPVAPDKKGASIDLPSAIAPAGAKIETEAKNPF